MKISNETKVGALTAIAIVILILGFNYLKGRNLTERNDELYAVFPNVKGLSVSNPVMINGLQVGKVSAMKETDKDLSGIIVTISIVKDINIPKNSLVSMSSELLGTTAVEIALGDAPANALDGDTLRVFESQSMMAQLSKSINPAIDNANRALVSVDSLIRKMNEIVDPATKANIQNIVANLAASSRSLERLINAQNGIMVRSLNNVESITGNLAKNNEKINSTIDNLDKTTEKFAAADIESVLTSLKSTMGKLETTIDNVSSKNGSIGMLLNDRQLYDEIRQTNRSLTTLLDDVRVNPKRYVSISVFGKKSKPEPLMSPIYDSTNTQ
ncbi:MAG: MlaD family protein [Flavitalea sp.]